MLGFPAKARWLVCLVAWSATAPACTGALRGGGPEGGDEGGEGGQPEQGGEAGSGPQGGRGGTPAACTSAARSQPAPLRRLSRTEYLNTVRDLFGGDLPTVELPGDTVVDGFDNNAAAQEATGPLAEAYVRAARTIASAVPDPAKLFGCALEANGCASTFLRSFGQRVFRRPLADDEVARYEQLFSEARGKWDADTAARLVVQALLMAPPFLYRPELGAGRDGERVALSPYELATRLSYFLWQTTPDTSLLEAAGKGRLATRDDVVREARRMLGDERAKRAVADFHRQWLALDRVEQIARDAKDYPNWRPGLARPLREGTERFVAESFWQGSGTVGALLTTARGYVNEDTARVWGISGVTGAELRAADADVTRRAGLLTQPGLLAALAKEVTDAPILRGNYVLRRFLCTNLSLPATVPPAPKPQGQPRTTRELVANAHSQGGCQSCHKYIDALGFMLEHYDALGQYRDQENGFPIDARASIEGVHPSVDGTYDGAIELSRALAGSPHVAACAGAHVLRFALGRSVDEADDCTVEAALSASKGNLREALVELVASDAFRFRSAP